MKKYVNRFLSILFACLVLISTAMPAYAVQPEEDSITPMYAVRIEASCECTVSPDYTLYIACDYAAGSESGVTRVDITVYVEKRNLLILWDRVDINQPNDEWTTICYGIVNDVNHTVAITPGTYRTTAIFEIYCGRDLVETIQKTTNSFTC